MTNPSDDEIDLFWKTGLLALEKLIPSLLQDNPHARKFVFAYSGDALSILYAVRKDGVPFAPERKIENGE